MRTWRPGLRLWWLTLLCLGWLAGGGPAAAQAETPPLPESAYVDGLVGHPQSYNLSCESRSAADFAAFFGVPVSETEFLQRLPQSDNPDLGFVGYVNDPWGRTPPASYGVHAAPVARLLTEYGVPAVARRGLSWDGLRQEIAAGRPAIVWVVGRVWAGTAVPYTAADGHTTLVAPYEHTMILVGYDATTVHLVNASYGRVERHALAAFLASWSVLDNMAVLATTAPADPAAPPEAVYIVRPGDSLLLIAARFNLTWHELAAYNGLAAPNVIYVGQRLRLPAAPEPAADGASPPPAAVENPVDDPPPPAEGSAGEAPAPENGATYVVQPGEYLLQIARRLGLDWQAVAQLNELSPPYYVLYPGQVLQLTAAPADARPPVAATPPAAGGGSYVVQPGDTLFKIATRLNLTWPDLAQLNAISYPYRIYAGQVLQLPAP